MVYGLHCRSDDCVGFCDSYSKVEHEVRDVHFLFEVGVCAFSSYSLPAQKSNTEHILSEVVVGGVVSNWALPQIVIALQTVGAVLNCDASQEMSSATPHKVSLVAVAAAYVNCVDEQWPISIQIVSDVTVAEAISYSLLLQTAIC